METFQYVDMFATKGIEYLLVILFLVLVVPFWLWMRSTKGETEGEVGFTSHVLDVGLGLMQRPLAPAGILLGENHSWVRKAADGALGVGIDGLVTGVLGDLDQVEVPAIGQRVQAGDPLLTLHLDDRQWVVPSPVSGEVVALDDAAVAHPRSIVANPYGVGLVTLHPSENGEALSGLLRGDEASTWLDQEFGRLVDLLSAGSPEAAPYFADGAYPAVGVLAQAEDELWDAFEEQFLAPRR